MLNESFEGHNDELDAVIFSNEDAGIQIRFTVSEFMGNHYMGIRKYFLSFEGEWLPTKLGFSWPYNIDSTTKLFQAFSELLSEAEVMYEVSKAAAKENNDNETD